MAERSKFNLDLRYLSIVIAIVIVLLDEQYLVRIMTLSLTVI